MEELCIVEENRKKSPEMANLHTPFKKQGFDVRATLVL